MSAGSPHPTAGAATSDSGTAALVPHPVAPRSRRQPRWIAAGLLAICLGALGSVLLYSTVTTSVQVLRVAVDLQRGDLITEGDLLVVEVSATPGVSMVPAAELATLIGQHALVDLTAGSLLPEGVVGALPADPGLALLGLRLTAGRVPIAPLPVGTAVTLVAVPATGQPAAGGDATPRTFDAVVVTAPQPSADGQATVLDVAVSPDAITEIAALAAADRLVLVKQAER